MFWSGNLTFANVLAQSSQWGATTTTTTSSPLLITVFIILAIAILSTALKPSSDDRIHKLNGFPLSTIRSFLSRRYDFLQENFKKTGLKIFYFNLLQHRVIAMAGEENRRIFFNDRSLDLREGYRILLGGVPRLEDINRNVDKPRNTIDFVKHFLRKERINKILPEFLEDVHRRMKDWGTEGKMNPFNEVYDLVFQMTVRMSSCRELSEDREAITQLAKHLFDIEKSASAVSILLPWFPGFAKKAKQKATTALYTLILSYVHLRREAATPSMDPIDFFISQGTPDDTIVETIMGLIFAGVINTGVNACWAVLHLGTNPKWKRKAIDEYTALVEKYTHTASSDPLHTRLSTIPLEAWEDELPTAEAIIRETLRISGSTTFIRRNIEKYIQVGETTTIKRGDFVAYSGADVHLNPDIYTDPMTFDPDRYVPGREEDRKESFGYLSWVTGRHTCAGMKIAKLEIKLVLAMILLGYEYELVDTNGNYPKAIPQQDRNDVHQSRPIGEPCYLKFKRIME